MRDKKLFSEFNSGTKEEWKYSIVRELKGKEFDSLVWHTEEGFDINPFYVKEDIQSKPGQIPGRIKKSWCICEEILVLNAAEAEHKAGEAVSGGADSLIFKFQEAFSKQEIVELLYKINFKKCAVNFSCESKSGQVLLEGLKAFLAQRKSGRSFSGSLLCNLVEGGVVSNEINGIFRSLTEMPASFRGITIFSKESKLVTTQLSSVLNQGKMLINQLVKNGFPVDEISQRIQLVFPLGNNYFFEIAKIRAARILWARLIDQYKPGKPSSRNVFIHCEIDPVAPDKYDRFIENTTRTMSGVIGGADSIFISSDDEFSQKINRNIQLLIKEESNFHPGDFASGSYYIESLTEKMVHSLSPILKK